MENNNTYGHLVLLMAPSGSGKGKIIDSLEDLKDKIYFAKTYTTRPRRKGTNENPLYTFVDRPFFEKMIEEDALVEWAQFSGNLYGTPKSEVLRALEAGKIVFKEMELQGILQMKALVPKDHLTVIYIDAGGWDALAKRITARAAISEEELELRRERYEEESKSKHIADVTIENHDGKLEAAQKKFRAVMQSIVEQ